MLTTLKSKTQQYKHAILEYRHKHPKTWFKKNTRKEEVAAPGEERSEWWVEGRRLVCIRSRGIISSLHGLHIRRHLGDHV